MQQYSFDRDKIFYPYVMNYFCSLHGFIDLVSRQLLNECKKVREVEGEKGVDKVFKSFNDRGIRERFSENKTETPLFIDPQMVSKKLGSNVIYNPSYLAQDLFKNGSKIALFQTKAAETLFIASYDACFDSHSKNDEMWNFFYHCRNAAAHHGKINVIRKKRFPAKWGNIEITQNDKRKPLFKTKSEEGILGPGDPIVFLWEMEQKYF